jgi:hypothetical protein
MVRLFCVQHGAPAGRHPALTVAVLCAVVSMLVRGECRRAEAEVGAVFWGEVHRVCGALALGCVCAASLCFWPMPCVGDSARVDLACVSCTLRACSSWRRRYTRCRALLARRRWLPRWPGAFGGLNFGSRSPASLAAVCKRPRCPLSLLRPRDCVCTVAAITFAQCRGPATQTWSFPRG